MQLSKAFPCAEAVEPVGLCQKCFCHCLRIYRINAWVLLLLFFYLSPGKLKAQDPTFSQFYANRIYLNPAFAGLEKGITATAIARMQWLNVDQGFKTVGFTIETQMPVFGVGLGLHFLRDQEGAANLTSNQAGAVFSYTIPGKKDNFHFGIEGRYVQKTIDWNRLIFSDQLDPWDGLVQSTSLQPILDKVSFGDLDFGFIWRHEGNLRAGKRSISKIRSHLGISFHHFPYLLNRNLKGNDSFLNREYTVMPRTTIHGGLIIPMKILQGSGTEVAFSPNFKMDSQGRGFLNFKQNMTVSTAGLYLLVNNLQAGLLYQNRLYVPSQLHTDSYILTIGAYTSSGLRSQASSPPLFLGLSFDLNTTGVGPVAGNVFEFTVRYRFLENSRFGMKLRGNSKSKNVLDCKSFF